jgi:excinuclease UvrABC ATPase subunit
MTFDCRSFIEMTEDTAREYFEAMPTIQDKLMVLQEVG